MRPRPRHEPPGPPLPLRRAARPGEALPIAEGVLWIRLPLAIRPDHVNAYALDDGDGWTIVDTGLDTPPSAPPGSAPSPAPSPAGR